MKILITGINGQVGHALMRELTNHELIGLTRQGCDLTNSDQIKQVIDQHQPGLIINPAAYTKVDQAEEEPELAFQINRDAPKVMAEKAREYHIPLIHFSTDYVFDGEKKEAYVENDLTHPLGIYGKSKCAGEEAIQAVGGLTYIFRTSWVYSNIGHNFFLTMKKLSQERDELKVVADQFGVPTSNQFIAEQIKAIIPQLNHNNTGIYHLVPDGSCSWHEFAKEIIGQTNPQFNLEHLHTITTNEFPTKTKRPANSMLSNGKIKQVFDLNFSDWKDNLTQIIVEEQ
ncbi:dTDP-4-dehydrorhamnose reductase [Methylophilaceae bacterium]|nr:dTDP-4-dehydrorhamnose reductase [Methylophilaceae bacterium]